MFKTSGIWALGMAALVGFLWVIGAAQAATPVKKPVAKLSKTVGKAVPVAAALSPEQLAIAHIVHTGRIQCELGQSVTVSPSARNQGAFDLVFAGRKYDVVPVPSKTGAIRLENTRQGIVYMQLANKSMLLNERQGRRMADDCLSPPQQAVAAQMKTSNEPSILDGLSK